MGKDFNPFDFEKELEITLQNKIKKGDLGKKKEDLKIFQSDGGVQN